MRCMLYINTELPLYLTKFFTCNTHCSAFFNGLLTCSHSERAVLLQREHTNLNLQSKKMPDEHKSYLAAKISLHSALLLSSSLINGVPVISIFTFMWLIHYGVKIPSLLGEISVDMLVMLPISSLCTSFFIVKTAVMYDRKLIKSKFLYFIKLFLTYYISIIIFTELTTFIIIKNSIFQKLDILTKLFLYYGINYFVVLIFIIVFYIKNKEYFRIQNFLME